MSHNFAKQSRRRKRTGGCRPPNKVFTGVRNDGPPPVPFRTMHLCWEGPHGRPQETKEMLFIKSRNQSRKKPKRDVGFEFIITVTDKCRPSQTLITGGSSSSYIMDDHVKPPSSRTSQTCFKQMGSARTRTRVAGVMSHSLCHFDCDARFLCHSHEKC